VDGPARVLEFVDLIKHPGALQVTSQMRGSKQEMLYHFELDMEPGLGISVIDSTPRELLFFSIKGLHVQVEVDGVDTTLEVTVRHFQMDDQSANAQFPVVLAPRTDAQHFAFHLSVNKSMVHRRIDYFRYFSVLVQEMDLLLDEAFVDSVGFDSALCCCCCCCCCCWLGLAVVAVCGSSVWCWCCFQFVGVGVVLWIAVVARVCCCFSLVCLCVVALWCAYVHHVLLVRLFGCC
jgi:hypothetical protein